MTDYEYAIKMSWGKTTVPDFGYTETIERLKTYRKFDPLAVLVRRPVQDSWEVVDG